MQRQVSRVTGMCLPVDVCNSAGDWYQGFILEEKFDSVVVHMNGCVWSSGDVIEVNIDRSELRRRICEISVS